MTWDKYIKYVEKNFRYIVNGDERRGSIPIAWDEKGFVSKTLHVTQKVFEDDIKKSLKFHLVEKLKGVFHTIPDNKKEI
ncbi:hypothetical protein EH221_07080 [bacterium]|nr:MAG: hypothetical protein EH221_07080 [bacterium]